MTSALVYASLVSAILAVVLAVARDVPILHLLMPPDVESRDVLPAAVAFTLLVLFTLGLGHSDAAVASRCLAASWIGFLTYFWWSVGWHLREQR
jgi:hypothetical protein